ncbi:hypothetical protein SLOPH_1696 [Spraguea lophii 42_110]|uniref:Nucleoporin Nup54 alpha-helical domain-containing protein n=1 Tax=Spraguea lophii (strain 42_110) TaxID=1358809 RepID=S7W6V0_SPRLO|nr:hypothetical protein SLOPH_1696 [Spraguea lophii 42_110]
MNNTFNIPISQPSQINISSNQTPQQTSSNQDNILHTIEQLEKYYDPTSPSYAFNFIFYNLHNTTIFTKPYDFPQDLWEKAISCAPSKYHYPVLIKDYDELKKRNEIMNEVTEKLNSSNDALTDRINKLKIFSIKIDKKIKDAANTYRLLFKQIYTKFNLENRCEMKNEILRLKNELAYHGKEAANNKKNKIVNKNEVLECIEEIKEQLLQLKGKVEKELKIKEDKDNIFK